MIPPGLTGPIAAGKSEVARLLQARGAFLVDADRVAQETYAPGGPPYDAGVRALRPAVAGLDRAPGRPPPPPASPSGAAAPPRRTKSRPASAPPPRPTPPAPTSASTTTPASPTSK